MRKFPSWIARNLIYYPVSKVMAGDVTKFLEGYLESQFFSREEIISLQERKLRQLLLHAKNTVPFYRDNLAFDPLEVSGLDLSGLPFVTKGILQSQGQQMRSELDLGRLTFENYRRVDRGTGNFMQESGSHGPGAGCSLEGIFLGWHRNRRCSGEVLGCSSFN